MREDLRKKLFAAQQRLAITTGEATALLVLCGLLATGGVAAYLQSTGDAVDTSAYPDIAAVVQAGASKTVEELGVGPAAAAEVEPEPAAPPAEPRRTGPARLPPVSLDPNTASSATLQRLPGIGPALATRIIEHREAIGPFRRPADLLLVRGIGPRTLERLEPYLRFEATTPAVDSGQSAEVGGISSTSSAAPSPDSGLR